MTINTEDKKCFIITPIGSNETGIRRATEGLIEAVIIPALNEIGFITENIGVAHRISESGSINRQIIKRIIDDDLAIVNLTGLNPNVMYELAVRHSIAKPVVILAEEGTVLPFDIIDQRTLFYKNDMFGVVQLKEDLKTYVYSAISKTEIENPLIQLIQENNALKNITNLDKNAVELILNRLDKIENNSVNIYDKSKKRNHFTGMYSIRLKHNIGSPLELNKRLEDLNQSLMKSSMFNYKEFNIERMWANEVELSLYPQKFLGDNLPRLAEMFEIEVIDKIHGLELITFGNGIAFVYGTKAQAELIP